MGLHYLVGKLLRDQFLAGHVNYDNPAAPGTTDIVNTANLTNTALTIAAQPDVPRNVVVTVVDTTPGITAGVVTVTGKNVLGNTVIEVIDCAAGAGTYTGNHAFATITSVVTSNFTVLGGAGDETIAVGSGGKLGLPVRYLKAVVKACVDGADETVGTVSTTYNTITPTTAANGTRDFDFWYTHYVMGNTY